MLKYLALLLLVNIQPFAQNSMQTEKSRTVPVFLLHGLGATPLSLKPLEMYLRWAGFENVHRISYPVNDVDFEESLRCVDAEMQKIADKSAEEVVLVGQSMGGVVANSMHKLGWKIGMAVYIGSPLHGARVLEQMEDVLPTPVMNFLHKKPYDFLKDKSPEEEPPHPYRTIGMSWPFCDFDGCVYRDEATLNEKHHTHLAWADHRTVFANPRLWTAVARLLDSR